MWRSWPSSKARLSCQTPRTGGNFVEEKIPTSAPRKRFGSNCEPLFGIKSINGVLRLKIRFFPQNMFKNVCVRCAYSDRITDSFVVCCCHRAPRECHPFNRPSFDTIISRLERFVPPNSEYAGYSNRTPYVL